MKMIRRRNNRKKKFKTKQKKRKKKRKPAIKKKKSTIYIQLEQKKIVIKQQQQIRCEINDANRNLYQRVHVNLLSRIYKRKQKTQPSPTISESYIIILRFAFYFKEKNEKRFFFKCPNITELTIEQ